MKDEPIYDCAIVGGGLGGLTLAINLAQKGFKIILFEKESYPFHKVCGEYISMESWNYLTTLGLPLNELNLPRISKLVVSAPGRSILEQDLPLGGFGISRYKIDAMLKTLAERSGVTVMDNTRVEDVQFIDPVFLISTAAEQFRSRTCCGSFGKRSNIDIKWKRDFVQQAPNKLNNFIAVKYHVQFDAPQDTIALHNFENGYCGISKIEDDRYCLCYLTNAANLKNCNNSIDQMEKELLSKNPHLEKILKQIIKLYDQPLSISQISFNKKSTVENNMLMIGDAAGMITPLCGNGMSMAMHAGKIASVFLIDFLEGKISRDQMERSYSNEWNKNFENRLKTGRMIQRFFGKSWLTNLFVSTMKLFPPLATMLIKKTHGKPF